MSNVLKGSRVLVTGACGTVGKELISQLLSSDEFGIHEIVGIDNNESSLFFLDQKFLHDKRANFYVADIRNLSALNKWMRGIDIVFHCAALKHVILSERSPEEAVLTHIDGVKNIIEAAQSNNVRIVIFTSSDKAVNPTNVMGTTKLMGERLMTAANAHRFRDGPIFTSTRFGNVLGSNGSVIPIFREQIRKGGPITLTHREMTRFVMSIHESVRLVIESANLAKGGEVFITKMPVIRIADLARVMINKLAPIYGYKTDDIDIIEIGEKPGEKLYEELMSSEEVRRTICLDKYFCVLPAFRGIYHDIDYTYPGIQSEKLDNPYVSSTEKCLSLDEIDIFLDEHELCNVDGAVTAERYWPGDKESSN